MRHSLLLLFLAVPAGLTSQAETRRPIALDDLNRLRTVSDPRISPDGRWVAYTVETSDTVEDEQVSDLWMTSWDGATTLRLTSTPRESEHTPRWSPDGLYLAFLSSRGPDHDTDQLWLLNRQGGEAEQLTQVANGIEDYAWAPDGSRLALVIEDGDSVEWTGIADAAPATDSVWHKTKPPIVIDRLQFKEDYTGYLRRKRKHLYLFTLAQRKLEQLTGGGFSEVLPAWSPDGKSLVFTSKRVGNDPDRHDNWDLWLIDALPGAVPRQLTTFTGPDAHPDWSSRPAFSPDGSLIAYLQGGPDSLIYYPTVRLAVVSPAGGPSRIVAPDLDRWTTLPQWSPDGRSVYVRLEDDRSAVLARISIEQGVVTRVLEGRRAVQDLDVGPGGELAVLSEQPDRPAEVYVLEAAGARALSHQNDSLLGALRLAPVDEITARSRDGTSINGLLVRPLDQPAGSRAPTILNLHGGPVSEFENDFNFYWQLLAAHGYAVVAMNPRGSSGRGEKFSRAIWADWGHRDVQDVLAGVDWAVAAGIADSARLGTGGWSYGGMLTNYVIASDTRFKAATSGAGIANMLAGYGTDQYLREYEAELGLPWKNPAAWLRVSYPFLHADRIRTPTLFLCGEWDANVPLINSQQMYQALRSLGVPTALIIYPEQYHGLTRPSYLRHRLSQYLAWFDRYLHQSSP